MQTMTPAAHVDEVVGECRDALGQTASGALLLRHIADLIEAGEADPCREPTYGALVDVDVGTMRCVVVQRATPSSVLSPREAEIAGMVARGLTNRAIANGLDISLWTVSTHLRRIFAKLAVHNRAEMVAMTYRGTRSQWL